MMGLEMESDFNELEEDRSQELTTEELTELRYISQQEVMGKCLSEEEEEIIVSVPKYIAHQMSSDDNCRLKSSSSIDVQPTRQLMKAIIGTVAAAVLMSNVTTSNEINESLRMRRTTEVSLSDVAIKKVVNESY
ncbi:hypothetical protein AVEN_143396-1 [Araneus ventricosus]|uniref:Uncharacterized protein n=1 Tax=Araneus ventricosus TaxID=182803 RepID=A0A4Y2AE34_ARAVE|nr:hypothetical protein AVEN_143396-1 [Araneus ventricosus]